MLKFLIIGLLALSACTAATNQTIEAVEKGVIEPRVDNAVIQTVNRACKAPIDVTMRAVDTFPALIPFLVESCPDTYRRLAAALSFNRPVTVEDLQRFMTAQQ